MYDLTVPNPTYSSVTPTVETDADKESAQSISKAQAIEEARALLRQESYGGLSTTSARHGPWAYGSLTPYTLDRWGTPVIYVARIAEHTRNLNLDGRCSLFVGAKPSGGLDPQAHSRLTLIGEVCRIPEPDQRDAHARYLARVPDAVDYHRTHSFRLFRIIPYWVRYIGGFGRIFWLGGETLFEDTTQDPFFERAARILDHMNVDHRDALADCCEGFYGVRPSEAEMVGIDRFGFDVESGDLDRRFRFEFHQSVDPDTARPALIAVVKEARTKQTRHNSEAVERVVA